MTRFWPQNLPCFTSGYQISRVVRLKRSVVCEKTCLIYWSIRAIFGESTYKTSVISTWNFEGDLLYLVQECSYSVKGILKSDSITDMFHLPKQKVTVASPSELPNPTLHLYALRACRWDFPNLNRNDIKVHLRKPSNIVTMVGQGEIGFPSKLSIRPVRMPKLRASLPPQAN